MKGFILLILGVIIAFLVVGGAVAYNIIHDLGEDIDSKSVGEIIDRASDIVSSSSSSKDDSGNNIISEEIKFNSQNDEGSYREVTYGNGGFRQYDTESGELIGSSYDSDQDKLPSLE